MRSYFSISWMPSRIAAACLLSQAGNALYVALSALFYGYVRPMPQV
jgi:hypothetical protein